jgi:hypothetical protein
MITVTISNSIKEKPHLEDVFRDKILVMKTITMMRAINRKTFPILSRKTAEIPKNNAMEYTKLRMKASDIPIALRR